MSDHAYKKMVFDSYNIPEDEWDHYNILTKFVEKITGNYIKRTGFVTQIGSFYLDNYPRIYNKSTVTIHKRPQFF